MMDRSSRARCRRAAATKRKEFWARRRARTEREELARLLDYRGPEPITGQTLLVALERRARKGSSTVW